MTEVGYSVRESRERMVLRAAQFVANANANGIRRPLSFASLTAAELPMRLRTLATGPEGGLSAKRGGEVFGLCECSLCPIPGVEAGWEDG